MLTEQSSQPSPVKNNRTPFPQDQEEELGVNFTDKDEKSTEKPIRSYFVHLFGKINFRNEAQFLYFGKWLVFFFLLTVEVLMILQKVDAFREDKGWIKLVVLLSLVTLLTTSEVIQLFAVRGKARFVFYSIDAVAACFCLFFAL